MIGRSLIIDSRCKLSYNNGYIVASAEEFTKTTFLEDIDVVVVSSREATMSAYLLDKLTSLGKIVIFCDSKKYPYSLLLPLYGKCAFRRSREQLAWDTSRCDCVWQKVVQCKISSQRQLLDFYGKQYTFNEEVLVGDSSNVEGRFADLYFHALFGRRFHRHFSDDVNATLNYGYVVLTSAMARTVVQHGYLPFWGFHHKGENNSVNLACDCVEPFRPLVDRVCYAEGKRPLDARYKTALLSTLNKIVCYSGKKMSAVDAMDAFFLDVVKSLQGDTLAVGELQIF